MELYDNNSGAFDGADGPDAPDCLSEAEGAVMIPYGELPPGTLFVHEGRAYFKSFRPVCGLHKRTVVWFGTRLRGGAIRPFDAAEAVAPASTVQFTFTFPYIKPDEGPAHE